MRLPEHFDYFTSQDFSERYLICFRLFDRWMVSGDASLLKRANVLILRVLFNRDSHPFQDRTIILNDVLKVGRSVARVKPAANNAIFDCKVLSRSHALIWYRAGRFWLRDTNSSNGTFVNSTRVVKKSDEEFADREIFPVILSASEWMSLSMTQLMAASSLKLLYTFLME
ncbi:unnamed protein product [Heterobilharzia americana]|nr:unnamed protein product [Heterobilharzia americana]